MVSLRAERLKTKSAGKWSQDGGTLPTEENFGTLESFLVTLLVLSLSIVKQGRIQQLMKIGSFNLLNHLQLTQNPLQCLWLLGMLHIYTSISHYNTQSDSLWPTLSTQYSLFKSLCRHRQRLVALESGLLVGVLTQRKHVPNLRSRLSIS